MALVTGAGTGIGAAVAQTLAADGIHVVLTGRHRESLDRVATLLRQRQGMVSVFPGDLLAASFPARLIQMIGNSFGRLDILINNAGVIRLQPLSEITVQDFEVQVATNIRAPLMLIKEALPLLKRSDRASVVNVTSSSAALNRPAQSVYSMTKAALNHLTRTLAAELAEHGIRVNAVAPGPVDTPIHLTWAPSRAAASEALAPQIPLGRLGHPEEVARWVGRLCDVDSAWMTGAVIAIDGGQTIDFR